MKKILPILAFSLLLTAGLAMGQSASLAFSDLNNSGTLVDTNPSATAGTFSSGTGTFTLDANLTWSGGGTNGATGLSYWLEASNNGASGISITNESYFTFTTAQDGEAKPWAFTASGGTDSGFTRAQSATQTGDLGATGNSAGASGTAVKVSTLTISLNGLAPGTYTLETTHLGTVPSEATVNNTDAFFGSQGIYTFTVVPEPATMSLMGLGALGSFGLTVLRRRRKA